MSKLVVNSYVYVVLEHATSTTDAFLHGIYLNKAEAVGKYITLSRKKVRGTHMGYIALLKKPLHGKPLARIQ